MKLGFSVLGRNIWDIQEKDKDALYTHGINMADRVSHVIPTVGVSTKVFFFFFAFSVSTNWNNKT